MRLSNWCNSYTTVSPQPAKNAQYSQKQTKNALFRPVRYLCLYAETISSRPIYKIKFHGNAV